MDYINHGNVNKLKFRNLSVILKSEETQTLEVDYFKLAMIWVEKQTTNATKKRCVLKNLFFLIRFPTMTLNEFHQCSSNEIGLFSNAELQAMIVFIQSNSDEKIIFPSIKRALAVKPKKFIENNRNKLMLANISNEIDLISGVNSSKLDLFIEKSIFLHGVNILFHPDIMKCWDKNIKHLTVNINISGGDLTVPLLHIFKMDIPRTFTGNYLQKFVRIEDQLKLPFSETKYSIFVKAIYLFG